jgi:hypothetical protein
MRWVTGNDKKGKGIDSRDASRGRTPARDFELFLRQDLFHNIDMVVKKQAGQNRSVLPVTTYNASSVKHLFTFVLSIELGRHLKLAANL